MLLDLDRFKLVNDAYGHAAGDDVLVETALRIRRSIRDGDAVVRLGGEEFLVLLEGLTEPAVLRRVSETICSAVRATPIRAGRAEVPITASIGAAVSAPGLCAPEELIAAADRALYAAKRAGRDRAVLIDDLPAALSRNSIPTSCGSRAPWR